MIERATGGRRRRTSIGALALGIVMAATTMACSGGGAGAQDDAAFCTAWATLEADKPPAEPREGMEQAIGLVETLRDTAPEPVADVAAQALETLREVQALADEHDWDMGQLRSSPDGPRFSELAAEMSTLNASGPLADHAHQVCSGADDPRFKLGCVASSFKPIPLDGETTPLVADPDQVADERLTTLDPGTTRVRQDLDGGGYEYAFLDADGTTVAVIEVTQDDRGGWVLSDNRSCR